MRLIAFSFLLSFLVLSCAYTKKVNNGQVAYDSKKYSIAVDLLQEEFNKSKDPELKSKKAFMLGQSYSFLNDNKKALNWYQAAIDNGYGSTAIRKKAFSLKREEMYVEAIKAFQELEKEIGKQALITREINICRQAMNWLKPKEGLAIDLIPFTSNSQFSDFAPVLYQNDYIVFSSDRENDREKEIYDWTGNQFSDFYIVNKKGGEVKIFDKPINSSNNEATIVFNLDYSEVYFTRCYSENPTVEDSYCRIMFSNLEEGNWSDPVELPFQNQATNYGHPTLIERDSVMVYSVKEIDGSETYDLYYSVRTEDGWSESFKMPSSINTDGNEKFPSSDGDTLYFSSDFLPGLGGLDIFKTYLLSDGSWSPPKNLHAPFNSGADDFCLTIDHSPSRKKDVLQRGYFSSSRNYRSNDDIFGFEVRQIEVIDTTPIEIEEEEIDFNVYLAGRVVYNNYEVAGDPSSKVIGKEVLENAGVSIKGGDDAFLLKTDDKGRFLQKLSKNIDYNLLASKEEYLNASKSITTANLKLPKGETSITLNVELALDKLQLDEEIVMESIYYDYDKYNIREDAKPPLNRLSEILKNNPNLSIELASHTDCNGNDAYNQSLSQKRAQAALNYVVGTGINRSRLKAKGFGEQKLIEKCDCNDCTAEQHQRNRRTTFKISLIN